MEYPQEINNLKAEDVFDHKECVFNIYKLLNLTEPELKHLLETSPNFFDKNDFVVIQIETLEMMGYKFNLDEHKSQLSYLASITQEERKEALYMGRQLVSVKLGTLFIEYQMGGKGSFDLVVNHLDFENRQARKLFNFSADRYGKLRLERLVPLLGDFGATSIGGYVDPKLVESADKIRHMIAEFALGKNVTKEKFNEVCADFLSKASSKRYVASKPEQNHSPVAIKSIADRLANIYFQELGVEEKDLEAILEKYRSESQKDIDSDFMTKLLNTLVDQDRYALKGLMPFTDDDLKKIVNKVNKVANVDNASEDNTKRSSILKVFESSKNNLKNDKKRKLSTTEEVQINDFKSKIITTLDKLVDQSINISFVSQGNKFDWSKNIKVIENFEKIQALKKLLGEKNYESLKDLYDTIKPILDKIVPLGAMLTIYNELQTHMQDLLKETECNHELKKPRAFD